MSDGSRKVKPSVVATVACLVAVLALLLLPAAGCGKKGSKGAKPSDRRQAPAASRSGGKAAGGAAKASRETAATDPCAGRLHELCGLLLRYYVDHDRLPERLDDLTGVAADFGLDVPPACAVSGETYVYEPEGLPYSVQPPRRMILYDPAPSHGGMRWAVVVEETGRANQPLILQVDPVPESWFAQVAEPPDRR